jgi:hypothetical protein
MSGADDVTYSSLIEEWPVIGENILVGGELIHLGSHAGHVDLDWFATVAKTLWVTVRSLSVHAVYQGGEKRG